MLTGQALSSTELLIMTAGPLCLAARGRQLGFQHHHYRSLPRLQLE